MRNVRKSLRKKIPIFFLHTYVSDESKNKKINFLRICWNESKKCSSKSEEKKLSVLKKFKRKKLSNEKIKKKRKIGFASFWTKNSILPLLRRGPTCRSRLFFQLRVCWTPPPPPLRSDHLDIRDAQCAENNDGCIISSYITSRLGAMGVQNRRFGRPKIQFFPKVAKFAGKIEIDLTLIFFCIDDFFCAIYSFWDMIDFFCRTW